jgi:hypothetical protein
MFRKLLSQFNKLHQQSSEKQDNISHRRRFFTEVENLVDEIRRYESNLHAFMKDTGSQAVTHSAFYFPFRFNCHTSLFALPYRLPLTAYRLPLTTTYRLPLTAYRRLPLTAYRLPLTAYRLPLTAYRLQFTVYIART